MTITWTTWIIFNAFVFLMLALDLGVFHRKHHTISTKEAAGWTVVWIVLALAFGVMLYWWQGAEFAFQYFTGYIIEKSLSADNIFIFVLIFSYFQVPDKYQHRVLFWGIIGALIMRGLFIALGATLFGMFHWLLYVFGVFLVFTGIQLLRQKEPSIDPKNSKILRWVRRFIPITDDYEQHRFFIKRNGRLMATPLFLVLVLVEASDVMFAVDSVPAIFAITDEPFIVYTANVFAILGLRSLYFLLNNIMHTLRYLNVGLSLILVFVGLQMTFQDIISIPAYASLAVIASILGLTVVASLLRPHAKPSSS